MEPELARPGPRRQWSSARNNPRGSQQVLPDVGGIDAGDAPATLSPYAKRIIDFLPSLSDLKPSSYGQPELRQIEDALTSLKLAVDGLLRGVKEQLGEN